MGRSAVLFSLLFPTVLWGTDGGMDSGGGDPYVMEFQKVGLVLARILKTHPVPDLYPARLADDILNEKTKLVSSPTVEVNGLARCAKYQRSTKTITISRKCWKDLDVYYKAIVICHEFRNIFGAHDYGSTAECSKLPRLAVTNAAEPEKRIQMKRLMGKAAEELMALEDKTSPFACKPHHFRDPVKDTLIETATCELQGEMRDARPVYWHPRPLVGRAQVEIHGATADWLVTVKRLNEFPGIIPKDKRPKYIQCSQNAWNSLGVCTFTILHQ